MYFDKAKISFTFISRRSPQLIQYTYNQSLLYGNFEHFLIINAHGFRQCFLWCEQTHFLYSAGVSFNCVYDLHNLWDS